MLVLARTFLSVCISTSSLLSFLFFSFNDTPTTEIYTLSLHDALPISAGTFLSAEGGSPIVQSVFLGGLFVVAALPSCFLWLAFGATAQRLLRHPRRLRVFNVAMGALLALSIVLIV